MNMMGNPSHALAPVRASTLVQSLLISGRIRRRQQAGSALLCRLAVGDLLDEIDDAAPKLGIGDAGEGAGEGQAL